MVNLTTVVMGPYATQIQGDLGADAVKIESPRDPVRTGTPYRHPGKIPLSLNANRNTAPDPRAYRAFSPPRHRRQLAIAAALTAQN